MINFQLSQIFSQMADFLGVDEVSFRSRAYSKAARVLESLGEDAEDIYQEGGTDALKEIPGVGEGIASKIKEYIETGKIKQYQRLKKQCPVDLEELRSVEGLGFKKIKILYKKLGVKNLKGLKKAAKTGKIGRLEGFGEKSEQNILQAIAFARAQKGRFVLGVALPLARNIVARLKELPEVSRASIAGSVRRRKETIGDLDILAASSNPKRVMDFFTAMPEIAKVWGRGETKSSVRLKNGLNCDLRVVGEKSFGSALQYFTGSKEHNIATRRIAKKRKLKLNEYGVFSVKGARKKRLAGRTEKRVYSAVGLPYVEPELRTNTGEIEAALENKLPKLIRYDDIKGDCHCHTDWSDGVNSIKEMAEAAKKIGYEYIVITDHGRTRDLDEKKLLKQMSAIDKVNKKLRGIQILKGVEVDARQDGSLLIADKVLAQLDVVIAAIHSAFKMSREEMTERLLKIIRNPHVNVLGHPTGRLLLRREPYAFDFERILKAAKKTKTALEINAHASRLDLRDTNVRKAVEAGVKLLINSDAHSTLEFSCIGLGTATARRGWAEKKDILNTLSAKDFLNYFGKKI